MQEEATGSLADATEPQANQTARGLRLGRRERALLGLAAVAAVVGALVLVLIGRSDLGADGVVVAVVLGVAVLQAATLAGLLYVVRFVRRDARKFQERMLRRTDRLARQGAERSAALTKRIEQAAASEKRHYEHVLEQNRKLHEARKEARRDAQQYQLAAQRQLQALLNLRDLVRLDAAIPPASSFAASPDLLLLCVDLVLAEKPELVVECGSGLSTLFLSLAAEQHGLPTRIVALEHHEEYAAKTRALLDRHGVGHRADVRLAPLERTSLPGHETAWYSEAALDGLDGIGILLVDGPPAATGPRVRYPAVPLLHNRLAARCTIVVDDHNRASDKETAESWSEFLPDFEYTVDTDFERHVGLLKRR